MIRLNSGVGHFGEKGEYQGYTKIKNFIPTMKSKTYKGTNNGNKRKYLIVKSYKILAKEYNVDPGTISNKIKNI